MLMRKVRMRYTSEEGGVVAVAELPQTNDDGGQAEHNVQEAGNDEQGVDEHDRLATRDVAGVLLHRNDVALLVLNNWKRLGDSVSV
jgi:hypothetical protein